MTFRRPWHGSRAARAGVLRAATDYPLTVAVGARLTPATDARNGRASSPPQQANHQRASDAPCG
jgi:hypothetical protein